MDPPANESTTLTVQNSNNFSHKFDFSEVSNTDATDDFICHFDSGKNIEGIFLK